MSTAPSITNEIPNINSVQDCKKICFDNPNCQAFNYNKTGKSCKLLSMPVNTSSNSNLKTTICYKLANNTYTNYDDFKVSPSLQKIESANPNISRTDCQANCTAANNCYFYSHTDLISNQNNPTPIIDKNVVCSMYTIGNNDMFTYGNVERKTLVK